MSETKKFTKEELEQIQNLREANTQKINEFGTVELEIILTNQRLESLDVAKNKLQKDFVELQGREQELVSKLNEKYGAGSVDIQSGEFIPSK